MNGDDDSLDAVEVAISPFPNDADTLKALLAALHKVNEAEQRALAVEAELANAREGAAEAMIAQLQLQNAKLRRGQYGASVERTEPLLVQMELELGDFEADAAEDERAAEAAAAKTTTVVAFARKKPVRKPFLIISRANAWSFPPHVRAQLAAAPACPSSARMSPSRWE